MTSALRTPPKRLALLSGLAAVIGLLGGGAAYLLVRSIALLTNVALFHRVGWQLPAMADVPRGPLLVVVAVAGALIVSLMARWSPEIRGHGLPEAMEAVLVDESRIRPRTAMAKPLSSVVAIGTGGPFGAEGPIIVTGGALGSLIGQVVPTSPAERKILLGCGAAAGMAATFGSPLAAVVLAIELLLFEYSARAFIPLVVAASLAAGVHSVAFGTGPLFRVPPHNYTGLGPLPFYVLLGLMCGLFAVVITRGLFIVEGGFRRLPFGIFWHPMIGALGFAMIGLVVPRSLGVGYDVIGDVLASRLSLGVVAVLGLAKLVSWWVALASGTSGGTLAPLLLISGCFGSLVGAAFVHLVPGLDVSPGAFALVAMAATFGAAIGATFTAIVFLFELTRDYNVILPLMLASVTAEIVSSALLPDTLMTEKLTRRGLHVVADYGADVLAGTTIRDVMTTDVATLPEDATVDRAREEVARTSHSAYPLVDRGGRCIGTVSRHDLLNVSTPPGTVVSTLVSKEWRTAAPGDLVLDAVELLLDENAGHLVVLDDGRLAGIVTRTDLLRARARQLVQERQQAGLAVRFRRRPRRIGQP